MFVLTQSSPDSDMCPPLNTSTLSCYSVIQMVKDNVILIPYEKVSNS